MEVKDFKELDKKLKQLAVKYPKETENEAKATMNIIVNRLQNEVIQRTPRGVGGAAGLAGSIFGEVQTLGKSITGIVGTPLEYGQVVELGRMPGKYPPVGALLSWVEKILGYSGKEAKSVEYLVARKIAKKGYKGKFMFRDAWNMNAGWVQNQLFSIPDRVINKVKI